MLDTIIWLVGDSNVASGVVSKESHGSNIPISLDTSGLAILLPGLKKFPNRGMLSKYRYRCNFEDKYFFRIFLNFH
jgi:hypothetical protein